MEQQYFQILQTNVVLMEEVILYSSTTLTIYEKRQRGLICFTNCGNIQCF